MDSFAVLKDGTSFDRKRFGRDISLFAEAQPEKHAKIEGPKTENIRKEFKIAVTGSEVPLPISSFETLFSSHEIPAPTQSIISSLYENMTPIQMQGIPTIFNKRDLIAVAPTGSGKTLSFALPLISMLKAPSNLRLLVISPTNELSRQLFKEFLVLSEGTKLRVEQLTRRSKEPIEAKIGYDVLVCSPLYILHWLGENTLDTIEYIVMDEADQLFDLGFLEQLDLILKKCPGNAMKMMFSATMLPAIELLAYSMLIDPVKIMVGINNATVSTVSQELKFCTNEGGKVLALKQMVQNGEITPPVLVFVQSKLRAIQLCKELKSFSIHVGLIHSNMSDRERDIVVKSFRTGTIWVLICTDLLSRGMDFHGVNLVINYDFPQSIVSYVHRIGRAGRAGEQARAVTLYTLDDAPYVKMIANLMKKSGVEVPEWMMDLKGPNKSMKKKIEKRPVRRENIGGRIQVSRTLRRFMKKKSDREK